MRQIQLGHNGPFISALAQGTGKGGHLARQTVYDEAHVVAIRLAIEHGLTIIDTSEEYGAGVAERAVAEAIRGLRDRVFLVSKASSEHLGRNALAKAAEASMKRLKTDVIDLYMVHWPNPGIPLEETLEGFTSLLERGLIRYVGVCNASYPYIRQFRDTLGERMITSQGEFNLFDRTLEREVLPLAQRQGMGIMAYSPLGEGRIAPDNDKRIVLDEMALRYDCSMPQVILAWLMAKPGVVPIVHSTNPEHIRSNALAANLVLDPSDVARIDDAYRQEFDDVPPLSIKLYEGDPAGVYLTIEQARENPLRLTPSPIELACEMLQSGMLKPVKVRRLARKEGDYEYVLLQGRLRFWAWMIAFEGGKNVPVLIQNS